MSLYLLPARCSSGYCAIMPNQDPTQFEESLTTQQSNTSTLELTDEEIAEAKESLRRYFEIGWKIASRLQREGRLDEVLTKVVVNPTVKPLMGDEPKVDHQK